VDVIELLGEVPGLLEVVNLKHEVRRDADETHNISTSCGIPFLTILAGIPVGLNGGQIDAQHFGFRMVIGCWYSVGISVTDGQERLV
jgi:hypothetical protein